MNNLQEPPHTIEPDTKEEQTSAFNHSMFNVSRISSMFSWIKHFFDYLGASREEPPPGASFLASPLWLGIWWGVLIGLILLFCGQTSKFIYIDF